MTPALTDSSISFTNMLPVNSRLLSSKIVIIVTNTVRKHLYKQTFVPLLTNSTHTSTHINTQTRTKTVNPKWNTPYYEHTRQENIQIPFAVEGQWANELLTKMPWGKQQLSSACYCFIHSLNGVMIYEMTSSKLWLVNSNRHSLAGDTVPADDYLQTPICRQFLLECTMPQPKLNIYHTLIYDKIHYLSTIMPQDCHTYVFQHISAIFRRWAAEPEQSMEITFMLRWYSMIKVTFTLKQTIQRHTENRNNGSTLSLTSALVGAG